MRTHVDAVLRDEARRFSLRFACDHCAHWNASTGSEARGSCGNGWPERVAGDALDGDEVAFCKEFELGGVPEGAEGG